MRLFQKALERYCYSDGSSCSIRPPDSRRRPMAPEASRLHELTRPDLRKEQLAADDLGKWFISPHGFFGPRGMYWIGTLSRPSGNFSPKPGLVDS